MKYKRLIIVLSSVFAFVVLCVILSFTLFRASNIVFDFHNATTIFAESGKQAEVIKSAQINTSAPIFSINKKTIVENLELRNPYLKVIKIETVFPNKLVLHCAEREETFCVKGSDDLYYICDDELKILSISKNVTSSQTSSVMLNGVTVLNTGASAGEILNFYEHNEVVKNISRAFAHSNKSIADIKAMIKNIEVVNENNFYTNKIEETLVLTTYDDFKIHIQNADSLMNTKINIMLNIVPQKPQYYKTHELYIDINPENTDEIYCVLEKI